MFKPIKKIVSLFEPNFEVMDGESVPENGSFAVHLIHLESKKKTSKIHENSLVRR